MIIVIKVDVTKLDKSRFFHGKNGAIYADLVLIGKDGEKDHYGNDFMVAQQVTKEEREAKKKGPIVGNGKILGSKQQRPEQREETSPKDDGMPF